MDCHSTPDVDHIGNILEQTPAIRNQWVGYRILDPENLDSSRGSNESSLGSLGQAIMAPVQGSGKKQRFVGNLPHSHQTIGTQIRCLCFLNWSQHNGGGVGWGGRSLR